MAPSRRPRVVAITGASRGLGLAIAGAFAAHGDRIYGLSRGKSADDRWISLAVDLQSPEDIEHAFETIASREGRLDILINNAAVAHLESITEMTPASIAQQLAVNFVAPLLCIQAALPLMAGSTAADIVCVSTESVLNPFPHLAAYAGAKAGLETAVAALRAEAWAKGVRLTVARLGQLLGTGFADGWPAPAREQALTAWTDSGHLAFAGGGMTVEGVAAAIAALPDLDRSARYDLVQLRAVDSL